MAANKKEKTKSRLPLDLEAVLTATPDYEDPLAVTLCWQSLHGCPVFLLKNVERVIANISSSCSVEVALSELVAYGLRRVNADDDKTLWISLSEVAVREQDYDDPEDWDSINALVGEFKFTIPDCHTRRRQKNFRIPEETRAQLNAIAEKLGLKASTLAQMFIMDGLLAVGGPIIHADVMEEAVATFYHKLHKRIRILAALLRAFEVDLCPRLETLVSEVEL